MHALRLAILAARLVDRMTLNGPGAEWSAFELETYWSASRVRLDRWSRGLMEMPVSRLLEAEQQERERLRDQAFADFDQPRPSTSTSTSTSASTSAAAASPASNSKRILRPHAPVTSPPPSKHSQYASNSAEQLSKNDSPSKRRVMPQGLDPFEALRTDAGRMRQLAEEILLSEVHCRVFSCLLHQALGGRTTRAAVSVGRSIWIGHQEVRCRLLNWLADGVGQGLRLADDIDRLRRRCERWSDLLLSRLPGEIPLEYAVDANRINDFRGGEAASEPNEEPLWPLISGSLEHMLPATDDDVSAHPQLNAQIHESTAAILSSGFSTASLEALWFRVERTARQMDDWILRCRE